VRIPLNKFGTPEQPSLVSIVNNELAILRKLKKSCKGEEVFLCLKDCYFLESKNLIEYLFLFPDNPEFTTLDKIDLSIYSFYDKVIIFVALAKGLKIIHDLDIVHRDIKPSNILINTPSDQIHRLRDELPGCRVADPCLCLR